MIDAFRINEFMSGEYALIDIKEKVIFAIIFYDRFGGTTLNFDRKDIRKELNNDFDQVLLDDLALDHKGEVNTDLLHYLYIKEEFDIHKVTDNVSIAMIGEA